MKAQSFFKIIFIYLLFVLELFSVDVPALTSRVVDKTNTFSYEEKIFLEKKLKLHESETTNQIAILIIPTLGGESLEEYSMKVVQTWKLGKKKKNNGVLLLIVKNDRKLRIEVGYGLESVLTDVLSNRIIRNEINPHFKNGNFVLGINNGIDKIVSAIK